MLFKLFEHLDCLVKSSKYERKEKGIQKRVNYQIYLKIRGTPTKDINFQPKEQESS